MDPFWFARNFTPTSIAALSSSDSEAGVAVDGQMVQGQSPAGGVPLPNVIVRPVPGVSVRAESSVARVLIDTVLLTLGVNVYDHDVVPVAGCHDVPPSIETSTPPTTPPTSLAVPLIVTGEPTATVAPSAGAVTA